MTCPRLAASEASCWPARCFIWFVNAACAMTIPRAWPRVRKKGFRLAAMPLILRTSSGVRVPLTSAAACVARARPPKRDPMPIAEGMFSAIHFGMLVSGSRKLNMAQPRVRQTQDVRMSGFTLLVLAMTIAATAEKGAAITHCASIATPEIVGE